MQTLEETARMALRIIDANANRAAEGLRTIEDYARMIKQDSVAASWAKDLRHQLANAISQVDRRMRLETRSTETDAGTDLTTADELTRHQLSEIIPAASERVTQALRCLEEYSKFISASTSQHFKQLRYTAYDLLAQIELRLLRNEIPASAQLYLLITCDRELDAFAAYVRKLAAAGVDWFQLRDKQADGGKLIQYSRCAVEVLRATSVRLIVNDRIDVALASGAAGVHVGQDDVSLADARRLAGGLWIGVSTHNMQQARAAEQGGADYIGCGPTFKSNTKSFDCFAGPEFLRQATKEISVPVFAIGGIEHSNLQAVLDSGCRRIAVSGVIHQATDASLAARDLKSVLQSAGVAPPQAPQALCGDAISHA